MKQLKLPLTLEQMREIAEQALGGAIVIFPTDTVYGIGTANSQAAPKIYRIKGRPEFKGLPELHCDEESAKRDVVWTPLAERLARRHWPGALTIVLKRAHAEGTVAVRVPNHVELRALIKLSGRPWLSTSANLSGKPASREVVALPGADYVIDGGVTAGIESTVVDATGETPVVLREGAIKL